MVFSSPAFVFGFLPAVLIGAMVLARITNRRVVLVWLVACSLFFYAWWHVLDLAVLALSVGVNYGIGQALYRHRSRALLAAGIGFNIILLGYFKYAAFLAENVNALIGTQFPTDHIALPLAISFITFQKIAYLNDAYRGSPADRSLLSYLFFACFFPQLIAGPIVHHRQIVPQLSEHRFARFERRDIACGGMMFLIGLYKKMALADGISHYADALFDSTAQPSLIDAWCGSIAYAFQIYFDFSGYTDMALGLALMFGLRLPVNFNSPYKATSIIDFWRRWHMTLSQFLRDFVYIPLGGNRHGPVQRHINLMLTMLIGGLWHGAAWTFVAWGGLHGAYLIINHAWRSIRGAGETNGIERWLGRVMTFGVIVVAWVFFRSPSFERASAIIAGMAGSNGMVAKNGFEIIDPTGIAWIAVLLAVCWFLPNTQQLLRMRTPLSGELVYPPLAPPAWLMPAWNHRRLIAIPALTTAVVAIILILLAPGGQNQPFIYMIF